MIKVVFDTNVYLSAILFGGVCAKLRELARKGKIEKNDPSDNRVLECALEAKADYLISGDKKHLLPLKKFQEIRIVSPREFLECLSKNL